jgi:hypothetical protein
MLAAVNAEQYAMSAIQRTMNDITLCKEVGHCYLHLIKHGTWSKTWCCQCKEYIEEAVQL